MGNKGFVMIFVLLVLVLLAIIAVDLSTKQAMAAEASRSRAVHLLQTSAQAIAQQWIGRQVQSLIEDAYGVLDSQISPTSEPLPQVALNAATSRLQSTADSIVCGQQDPNGTVLRIFFTATACGETLSPPPSPPRRLGGNIPGLVTYEFPYVLRTRQSQGDYVSTRTLRGALIAKVGDPSPSEFELFVAMGTRSTGDPAYLEGDTVFDGPVYVGGLPYFRGPGGPYFLSGLTVGLCPAFGSTGCSVNNPGKPYFNGVGDVAPEELFPSPLSPCYGSTCIQTPGGLSWYAPAVPPPSFDPVATAQVLLPGDSTLNLQTGIYNGQPADRITIYLPSSASAALVIADRTYLEAPPGFDLTPFASPAASASPGWVLAARPSGTDGVLEQYDRDAYYGDWFAARGSQSFRVSFEANANGANGPVQVGFTYQDAMGNQDWIGTDPAVVYPGRGWQSVSAVVTLPAKAVKARVWTQIGAPRGNTGRALLRNLKILNQGSTVYVPLDTASGPRVFTAKGSLSVSGPVDKAAYTGLKSFTIAATGDILIKASISSANPPCQTSAGIDGGTPIPSRCSSLESLRSTPGILGLYSQNGNILVDNNNTNYTLNVALLAPQGAIGLNNYTASGGILTLTGSLAGFYFNGFRNPADKTSGYTPYLSFDPRLSSEGGVVPEGWPRLSRKTWAVSAIQIDSLY